jgi:hypothetical protein
VRGAFVVRLNVNKTVSVAKLHCPNSGKTEDSEKETNMRLKILLTCILVAGFAPIALAQDDMEVYYWNYSGCQHTMTTNHFELAPGAEVAIDLDLLGCYPEDLGGLLFFGYKTTKTHSKQLTSRDKVFLSIVDETTGEEITSRSGRILTEIEEATSCVLYATNTGRKTIKIRLRSSAGL